MQWAGNGSRPGVTFDLVSTWAVVVVGLVEHPLSLRTKNIFCIMLL